MSVRITKSEAWEFAHTKRRQAHTMLQDVAALKVYEMDEAGGRLRRLADVCDRAAQLFKQAQRKRHRRRRT